VGYSRKLGFVNKNGRAGGGADGGDRETSEGRSDGWGGTAGAVVKNRLRLRERKGLG